jgi:hypothetical protein
MNTQPTTASATPGLSLARQNLALTVHNLCERENVRTLVIVSARPTTGRSTLTRALVHDLRAAFSTRYVLAVGPASRSETAPRYIVDGFALTDETARARWLQYAQTEPIDVLVVAGSYASTTDELNGTAEWLRLSGFRVRGLVWNDALDPTPPSPLAALQRAGRWLADLARPSPHPSSAEEP